MIIDIHYKNFKLTKSIIAGIILILIGGILLVTSFLDIYVTTLLWPLLEGSSEGKTVLFLGLLGILLIISSLFRQTSIFTRIYDENNDYHLKYVASVIIILLACAFIGLIIEFYIRSQFGVSYFTILTSMHPYASTTSPMHSHLYKSILGNLLVDFAPMHVNTGSSILNFGLPFSLIIIPVWIYAFFVGLFSISNMKSAERILSLFALALALIGILDGGLFSQPFLIGLFILLVAYYSNGRLNFRKMDLNYLINPVVIIGYILLIAIIIEVGGTNSDIHTLTVINQTGDVNMTEFDVISVDVNGDATTYVLNTTMHDKELIIDVFNTFENNSDVTFMSWNFYSYLDNPTMRLRQGR